MQSYETNSQNPATAYEHGRKARCRLGLFAYNTCDYPVATRPFQATTCCANETANRLILRTPGIPRNLSSMFA